MPATAKSATKCLNCGVMLKPADFGRPPLFCSSNCRQQTYAARKAAALAALRREAATNREIHVVLARLGLIDGKPRGNAS